MSTGYRYPEMQPAGQQATIPGYKWLRAAPRADIRHVDLRVLRALDRVGSSLQRVITINSGYRDPAYSVRVGGYANDPHTRGVASDAYIGNTPIGSYPGAFALLGRFGLESGATPGFYHGKSDPEHVQIPGSGVNKALHALYTLVTGSGGGGALPPTGAPAVDPSSPTTGDAAGAVPVGCATIVVMTLLPMCVGLGYLVGWLT